MASTWLDPCLSRVLLYLYYLVFVYFVFVSFYICVFLYLCICHLRKVPASTWLAPCLPPAKMFRIFLELAATPAQRMSSPRITGQFCSQRFEAGSENRKRDSGPLLVGALASSTYSWLRHTLSLSVIWSDCVSHMCFCCGLNNLAVN